jgi:hypothetical protein
MRNNHEEYKKTEKCEYGLSAPTAGAKWSGKMPVPAIGDRLYVNMNSFGNGTVRGYFVEHGWQGVYIEPNSPPGWWLKQNAKDPIRCCMIFGIELEPERKEVRSGG